MCCVVCCVVWGAVWGRGLANGFVIGMDGWFNCCCVVLLSLLWCKLFELDRDKDAGVEEEWEEERITGTAKGGELVPKKIFNEQKKMIEPNCQKNILKKQLYDE